jgi:signal transduction histidine kinase
VAVAVVLFGAAFAARLAVDDPGALLANFYVIPVAVLAIEFGVGGGVLAALVALGLVFAWNAIDTIHLSPLGYISRFAVALITGTVVGRFSERLRADIDERQRAQRRLALYADELERANRYLGRSVERLEAFAQIARAVGGETDLDRVLELILAHGKEVIGVSELVVYLRDGSELVAVSGPTLHEDGRLRLPVQGSLAGQVLLSGRSAHNNGALLVPMAFRGEQLGVLAGTARAEGRPLSDADEQLLMSVAASAATAIATARSVAAERLRLSLEAAEEERARWARELHDESLQGLSGVRMVLSAGLACGEEGALRVAAESADEHLGEEMRKLRDLVVELRPAALDDLGLGPAIESLANRQAVIGGFTVDAELKLDPDTRLAREIEIVTYRIVQEALNNVVKHAGATRVMLNVTQLADQVELRLSDDGRGFDPDEASEGFGLIGMRERALLVGGTLSVTSGYGRTTCISAVLPNTIETDVA